MKLFASAALSLTVAAALGAVAIGGAAYGARPPRPDLAMPDGHNGGRWQGHCVEGSETWMCAEGEGPRSYRIVRVHERSMPNAAQELFALLEDAGYTRPTNRLGFVPDAPLLNTYKARCRSDGSCVGLHPLDGDTYVLGWWR